MVFAFHIAWVVGGCQTAFPERFKEVWAFSSTTYDWSAGNCTCCVSWNGRGWTCSDQATYIYDVKPDLLYRAQRKPHFDRHHECTWHSDHCLKRWKSAADWHFQFLLSSSPELQIRTIQKRLQKDTPVLVCLGFDYTKLLLCLSDSLWWPL